MAYAAPSGDNVLFNFTASGYVPPSGDAVPLDFQGTTLDASINGSGGVRVGGVADEGVYFIYIEAGAGGMLVGGLAASLFIAGVNASEVGAGGITIGGLAPNDLFNPLDVAETGAGGVLVGGIADEIFTGSIDITAAGGILVSGHAIDNVEYVWIEEGFGGITVGGAAPNSLFIPNSFEEVASGGVRIGGTAPNALTVATFLTVVGSGGVMVGGIALVNTLIDEVGLGGGIKVGGAAPNVGFQVMEYNDIGSGGIKVAGNALAFKFEPHIDARLPRPNASLSNIGWSNYIFGKTTGVVWAQIDAMVGANVDAKLTVLGSDFLSLLGTSGEVAVELHPMEATLEGGESIIDGIHGYIPSLQADLAGMPGITGTVDVALTTIGSDFIGFTETQGRVDAALTQMQGSLAALNGVIGSIDALLHRIRGDSVAVIGTSGLMACILPTLQARVTGYSQIDAAVTAKMTSLRGELVGDIMPMYVSTMMLNTINSALSEYERFEFSSFCEHKGSYYATGPDGLVKVDVRDDDFDGTDYLPIDAVMSTGDLDFGSEMQKRIADFYVAMRAAGDLKLNIATDENDPVEYTLSPFAVDTLKQRRVITAKGARGKYWRFELSNTDGCDFEVDTMNVAVTQVTRRI